MIGKVFLFISFLIFDKCTIPLLNFNYVYRFRFSNTSCILKPMSLLIYTLYVLANWVMKQQTHAAYARLLYEVIGDKKKLNMLETCKKSQAYDFSCSSLENISFLWSKTAWKPQADKVTNALSWTCNIESTWIHKLNL